MAPITDPPIYSPGRAKNLRVVLWAAVVLASIFTALAVWVVLAGGSVRFAGFLAGPGVLLLLSAGRTLTLLEDRGRPARFGAIVTGILLLVFGMVLANAALGILPSIVGVLVLVLALLPDVGDH